MRPIKDKVLIRKDEIPAVSSGGLHIPNQAQSRERADRGTVLSIGSTVTEVAVGDRVVFGKTSGTEIKLEDGSTGYIMAESEIRGILLEEICA